MKILEVKDASKAVKILRKKIEKVKGHELWVHTRQRIKVNGKFEDVRIPFKCRDGTCEGVTIAVIKDKGGNQLGIGRAYCSIDDIWKSHRTQNMFRG